MLVAAMDKQDHRKDFAELGYFIVRGGFSRADITAMRERLEAIIHGEYKKDGRRFQPDTDSGKYEDLEGMEVGYRGPDVAYRKIADLEYDDVFLKQLQNPWIQNICTDLLGDVISIMRVTMMDKPAQGGTPLPWHQDVSLDWPTSIQPGAAIWFPLDVANEASGSLQIIPGSHLHGVIGRGHLLPADLEKTHAPANKILTVEMQPGDCLFFHAALLHRSGVNTSDAPRRAVNAVLIPGRGMHTKRNIPYPILFGEGQLEPAHVATLTAIPK